MKQKLTSFGGKQIPSGPDGRKEAGPVSGINRYLICSLYVYIQLECTNIYIKSILNCQQGYGHSLRVKKRFFLIWYSWWPSTFNLFHSNEVARSILDIDKYIKLLKTSRIRLFCMHAYKIWKFINYEVWKSILLHPKMLILSQIVHLIDNKTVVG